MFKLHAWLNKAGQTQSTGRWFLFQTKTTATNLWHSLPIAQLQRWWHDGCNELWPTHIQQISHQYEIQNIPQDIQKNYCPRCGVTVEKHGATQTGCAWCAKEKVEWNRIVRLGNYGPFIREGILALKFQKRWQWSRCFAQHLGNQLQKTINELEESNQKATSPGKQKENDPRIRVALCPVPLHWIRRHQRGYNQAKLLAKELGIQMNWPVIPLLKRTRWRQPQSRMTPGQRWKNVRGSFKVQKIMDLRDWDIWLVDDVKTTGATLSYCAKLLKRAGARQVNVVVVAVADIKHQTF